MENEMGIMYKPLHKRSYRQLQQLAKSLDLPSNFKKVYLIEMIFAKKFKSEKDVFNLIQKVKLERLQKSRAKRESNRRKNLQIPATSKINFSPPISATPKLSGPTNLKYNSKFLNTVVALNPKRSLLQQIKQNTVCDRVLRSCNLRSAKPNYALLDKNLQDFKPKCCEEPTETKIKIITNDSGRISQLNVTAKCYVKKSKPVLLDNNINSKQLMLKQSMDILENQTPARRQRTVSGIYPLLRSEMIPRGLPTNDSVFLRNIDGSLTKISAFVQKRNLNPALRQKLTYRNTDITNIQDIINNSLDANFSEEPNNNNLKTLNLNASNMNVAKRNDNAEINFQHNMYISNEEYYKENVFPDHTNYYAKKITTDQMRFQKPNNEVENGKLPKINDVFTKFNNVYTRDLTQPLYVNVNTESERNHDPAVNVNRGYDNTMDLEKIYNIKTPAPFYPIKTTSNTTCTYSTQIFTTPMMHPSAFPPSYDALNVTSYPTYNYQDIDSHLYSYLPLECSMGTNCDQGDDFRSPSSTETMETSLEDALELMCQDRDLMKQMGMDTTQCVMCSWAGPRIILDNHIRQEHNYQIHKIDKGECNITYTLESVVKCRLWLSQIIELDSMLYVLSAKYEDPGLFMATLSSLSTEPTTVDKIGSITIYNKITGEPFSWNGYIKPLQPNIPYQNEASALKVDLSNLDLLPNSAKLKLVNGELVTESPSKVVVGPPHLNDIHIILFIKIYN